MKDLVEKYIKDFNITYAEFYEFESSPLPAIMSISLPEQIIKEIKKKGITAEEFSRETRLLELIKNEKIRWNCLENPKDIAEFLKDSNAYFDETNEKLFLTYYERYSRQ